MYLDEELIDIDNLCYFAHVRIKWKLWEKIAKARSFLLKVGNLYIREEEYRRSYLPPDEIRKRRNDACTNGVVKDLWKEFDYLHYLNLRWTTWSDVLWIIYICFGRVFQLQEKRRGDDRQLGCRGRNSSFDSTTKNCLFFCNTQGALNSTIYIHL